MSYLISGRGNKLRNLIVTIIEFFSWNVHAIEFKKYLRKKMHHRIRHNKILVEFEQPSNNIIALSELLPYLLEKYDASALAYMMYKKTKISFITRKIRYFFSVSRRLLGSDLLEFSYDVDKANTYYPEIQEIRNRVHNIHDLMSLTINGILIGDLVYDRYLAINHVPTVEINSKLFNECLDECLFYFFRWQQYLSKSEIKALCVSHSVYHFGIPLRIAINREIEVFQVSVEAVYRLSRNRQFAYMEEFDFHRLFESLPEDVRQKGIEDAKHQLVQHCTGKLSSAVPYLTVSSFNNEPIKIRKDDASDKITVLVATHDFYDSPHVFGEFFYSDFFHWLHRLGEISNETNYEWLIKTHPYLRGDGREILKKLCNQYPKFTLLGQDVSHNSILAKGVDFALTVYGTIAMEYACFGIPTINASINNPHESYKFSMTPKDKDEYEDLLYNLDSQKIDLNYDEVFEFYFIKHILREKSWVFKDYDKYLQDLKIREIGINADVYAYFLEGSNNLSHDLVSKELAKFILGSEYRLTLFGLESSS
jgi:hypothetical protein